MRGYEITDPLERGGWWGGYESPCGVMRNVGSPWCDRSGQLRIPMRGYEPVVATAAGAILTVTNPHAGL